MSKKKKIIVMSSLVLLLAVTAVLNVLLAQNSSAEESTVTTANYFTTYRTERTTTRSEELLQLDSIIALYDADSEEYASAVSMKMEIVSVMEQELIIETMIKSIGFSDAVVAISTESGNVNVFINSSELDYDTALSIYNLLLNEAGVSAGNIIIMPVYSEI
ncbi:MAG: SpoIIIAH-like family protein [Clostridia bacterium]|nr:SpoIIIAH-like family protein [Clostridia bacterium]